MRVERTQLELVVPALSLEQVGLRLSLVARAIDGALVLGPEALPQLLDSTAPPHRQCCQCNQRDRDDDDDDPQPGGHECSLLG